MDKLFSKFKILIVICAVSTALCEPAGAISLDASPEMQKITDHLIKNKIYTRPEISKLLGSVEIDKGVLQLLDHQAEAQPWHKYRHNLINRNRIKTGKRFMLENRALLSDVEKKYGVPPNIITALLGIETSYGSRMGSRSVLRSLATLTAAYPRRAKFFSNELQTFLTLLKTEKLVAADVEGSYAGAVGIPQFMPTSYVAYAVDFNKNGKRDLVHELEDAVASVANYLVKHGWKKGAPIAQWLDKKPKSSARKLVNKRAKPKHTIQTLGQHGISLKGNKNTKVSLNKLKSKKGDRYFVGYANFYAITRYNPSNKYAMAIVELSNEVIE